MFAAQIDLVVSMVSRSDALVTLNSRMPVLYRQIS